MIPKLMEAYLRDRLTETAIQNRTQRDAGMCYMEFGYTDEHLLSRLGINRDSLGPRLLSCVWDEVSDLEIGGYVVIDNLAMGAPSMGGIRMLPDITPVDIYNLARGMTLKNGAANLPYGGGKSGIVAGNLSPEDRTKVVSGFARLIRGYGDIYVPGPDVGTNDADMKTIAIENGIDSAVSKPADMGGNRIDELGAAAGGIVIAFQTLLEIMPRLKVLPQFAGMEIPSTENLTVIIQGFGAVGSHAARLMNERMPSVKIIGISDIEGYLYDASGLPVNILFNMWKNRKIVTTTYFAESVAQKGYRHSTKFSTDANNLLRESAFCMIPASSVFNYLDVPPSKDASMTVDRMGKWSLIVEGANTYSPDPNRKAVRMRMEQEVYRRKGVMIANDYLVNSGGVIFAAQEHLVPTPAYLQIPENMLGNRNAVDEWLSQHAEEFAALSRKRLIAGEEYREKVIRRNMIELIDMLAANSDLLPCKAAERVSVQRLTAKENERTAKDIMEPIPTVMVNSKIQYAAALIVETKSNIVAVLSPESRLAGVVTSWDITQAIAEGTCEAVTVDKVMTENVVSASPSERILDIVRELEQHKIWAMPVVDENGKVLGKVSSDLLAYRFLLPILQSQEPL